jgi:hypothetical protein
MQATGDERAEFKPVMEDLEHLRDDWSKEPAVADGAAAGFGRRELVRGRATTWGGGTGYRSGPTAPIPEEPREGPSGFLAASRATCLLDVVAGALFARLKGSAKL